MLQKIKDDIARFERVIANPKTPAPVKKAAEKTLTDLKEELQKEEDKKKSIEKTTLKKGGDRPPKYRAGQMIIEKKTGKKHKVVELGEWDEDKKQYRLIWGKNGVGYESDVKPNDGKAPTTKKEKTKKTAPVKSSGPKANLNYEDCEDLLSKNKTAKKKSNQAVEKSENKHLNTKLGDKFEIMAKQIANDKDVKAKAEKNPSKLAQQLKEVEASFLVFINKLNALTGKQISSSRAKEILAVLRELKIA